MNKTIYELDLHETLDIEEKEGGKVICTRVAGGWIYSVVVTHARLRQLQTIFVPFNNEFQEK